MARIEPHTTRFEFDTRICDSGGLRVCDEAWADYYSIKDEVNERQCCVAGLGVILRALLATGMLLQLLCNQISCCWSLRKYVAELSFRISEVQQGTILCFDVYFNAVYDAAYDVYFMYVVSLFWVLYILQKGFRDTISITFYNSSWLQESLLYFFCVFWELWLSFSK